MKPNTEDSLGERERLLVVGSAVSPPPDSGDIVSYNKKETLMFFLRKTTPLSFYSFINSGAIFINMKLLSEFADGLPASAYILGFQTCLLDPITSLMYSGVNVTGKRFGKSKSDKSSSSEKEMAKEEIGHIFRHITILAALTSIPCAGILLLGGPALNLFKQPEGSVDITQEIFHAMLIGIVPRQIFRGHIRILIGLGKMKTILALLAMYSASVTSLSYLLMSGPSVFPRLGPVGYGYAWSISAWLICVAQIGYIGLNRDLKSFNMFSLNIKRFDILKEILSIGWPIGVKTFLEEVGLTAASIVIGTLGKSELSMSQVVSMYVLPATSFILHGCQAHTGVVSQARGEKNFKKARFLGTIGLTYGFSTLLLAAGAFCAFPNQLASFFTQDQEIIATTRWLFMIQGGTLVLDAIRNFNAASLQAFDDTKATMYFNLLSLIIFGGAGWALGFPANLKVNGIFLGRTAGILVSSLLLTERWFRLSNKAVKEGKLEKDEQPNSNEKKLMKEASFFEDHLPERPATQSRSCLSRAFCFFCPIKQQVHLPTINDGQEEAPAFEV